MVRVFFVTIIVVFGVAAAEPNPFLTGKTEVIAHRGGIGPDSTIANIKRSLDRGYHFIELDVRLTKDGKAVILHDPTVDRTTDGTGDVAQLSFEAVRKLDAGAKYQDPDDPKRSYKGERIPTPEEVLRVVGKRGIVLLELKVPEAAEPVAKAIVAEDAYQRAIIRTADNKILAHLRKHFPSVRTGTMAAIPKEDLAGFIKSLQTSAVSALTPRDNTALTLDVVKQFHHAKIAIWATNTNDAEVMKKLIDVNVAGIITDVPGQLQKLLPKNP